MNLNRYHEQHADIHAQLRDLHQRLEPAALAGNPDGARQSLVAFGAKLNIHLAFEDQVLYPPLLKHADPAVQAKARRFMEEMGGLKRALGDHLQRWISLQAVQGELQRFDQETRGLLQALERRLAAEEGDFYPMLEALA